MGSGPAPEAGVPGAADPAAAPFLALFARLNARDAEGLAALLDPEAVFLFPKAAPLLGPERILRFFKLLWRGYPELRFTVQEVILASGGQRAALHWTNAGRTRAGAAYTNEGVTLLHLREGRFVGMSDFFKDTERF